MSKLHYLFVLCFFTALSGSAQYSLSVSNPHFNVNQRTQGIITSPEVVVTPDGAYARVDMTFTINPQSTYKVTDSLEAVLLFDLPAGSFIHDSWLWLDENTIIKADVVEKNRAISIYEGIVKRKRDPSLLYKTGENSYQLNVYPMTTAYPRKVKITYVSPLKWHGDHVNVALPVHLFESSQILPDIIVKVKNDFFYSSPGFVENDYNKYFLGKTNGEDALVLRGADYKNNTFNLRYTTGSNEIQLYTYPVNNSEGVYQLIVPPAAFGLNKKQNVVFIIDHPNGSNTIYSLAEVLQELKIKLLTDYSTDDSFNLFYEYAGNIVQAFQGWHNIDIASVNAALSGVPSSISKSGNQYPDLIKSALSFCASKSASEAQVVLLSNNNSYTNNQSIVDQMYKNLITDMNGSLPNKIDVVNYSTTKQYVSGSYYYANDIWYSKLTLGSGGSIYRYKTYLYKYINGKYSYTYDFDLGSTLTSIAENSGSATASYNVNVSIANGFTYSRYNLNSVNKLNMSRHYIETGRYSGNIMPGSVVDVNAISGGNAIQLHDTINTIMNGNNTFVPVWTHHYISELIGKQNPSFVQEIIDSSINNRVLCSYTAFLAIESGDTVNTNLDDNPNVLYIGELPEDQKSTVKCFPNPFRDRLTIEFPNGVERIEVFDLTGRKVYSHIIEKGMQTHTWNGKDMNGNDLPAGMYMVIGYTASERFTAKVMKQ
ncbi:MAG: T9SS type A sorting domain-containing protein [Chitinophagaceae bacterium]|nr:T9SS type A sorting domain-containing protein [Chitinophagaceae bacterium]MCB9046736.1 T9SS type A sorting domain-containing protein [Chitinophagales bacterium]